MDGRWRISVVEGTDDPRLHILMELMGEDEFLLDEDLWGEFECVALAESGDDPVGAAALTVWPLAEIVGVWVAPCARGNGLGSALVHQLAIESEKRLGLPGHVHGASMPGRQMIAAARRAGARLVDIA